MKTKQVQKLTSLGQIETISVDRLKPYDKNSRTHSPEQIQQLCASIQEWGWTIPILIDPDYIIIAGHARIEAAKKLGITEVPCLVATNWTEAQKKAYVIADNKLAENAGWDEEFLASEFAELNEAGYDLGLTGFEHSEIESILSGDGIRGFDEAKYTTTIATPIYEIKGDKPKTSEIYSIEKYIALTDRIRVADLPDDIRQFLLAAASRHIVFNYEKIAEFYVHQDPEVQALMEQSALVIIDFKKAIELGYVKMTEAIISLSGESADV